MIPVLHWSCRTCRPDSPVLQTRHTCAIAPTSNTCRHARHSCMCSMSKNTMHGKLIAILLTKAYKEPHKSDRASGLCLAQECCPRAYLAGRIMHLCMTSSLAAQDVPSCSSGSATAMPQSLKSTKAVLDAVHPRHLSLSAFPSSSLIRWMLKTMAMPTTFWWAAFACRGLPRGKTNCRWKSQLQGKINCRGNTNFLAHAVAAPTG